MRLAHLLCSVLAFAPLLAQESPTPSPFPTATVPPISPRGDVPLRFALPPLEGTISLGIYNAAGKLVRVLHREDTVSDFTAGHDALETSWDGKDEAGALLPNGKYHARGFIVGDLKVEGVDYFFNDWVTDEHSPHVAQILQLGMQPEGLRVDVELAGGAKHSYVCEPASGAITTEVPFQTGVHCDSAQGLPSAVSPVDCATGREGSTWFIDSAESGGAREVKQLSAAGEPLRRLDYSADEPQPQFIEASTSEETIFLVEKDDHLQRLRALTLIQTTAEGGESVSDWKTHFEKKIVAHQNFALAGGKPVAVPDATSRSTEKIVQKLRPDPLQHDKPGKVELAVGFDADGSYLGTADGLPLRTISDTRHLSRALLGRANDNAVDVFQDDGAVVEQFRISNLGEMIAFDCGQFEVK